MDFTLSDERRMLRESLRGTLERGSGANWGDLAELGLFAALVSEADGGFGGEDVALVFEELGRAGCALPVLDQAVLGAGLVAAAGSDVLEGAVAGQTRLSLAHEEQGGVGRTLFCRTAAERLEGGSYRLRGGKSVVVGGIEADRLIVSARLGGAPAEGAEGLALFLVPADAPGLERRAVPLQGGGEAAEIILDGVEIGEDALLLEGDAAAEALGRAEARAILALCAEMLGLMDRAMGLTVEYSRTRKQFGKPIGAFQALQHRMADMAMEVEQSRSAVFNLARAIEGADRDRQASAAKTLVGRTARLVAEESIQIHGGIGMTEEYELGHLVRRLIEAETRFGDSDHHLQRFVELSRPLWEAQAA